MRTLENAPAADSNDDRQAGGAPLKRLSGETIRLPSRLRDRPDRDRLALRLEWLTAVA